MSVPGTAESKLANATAISDTLTVASEYYAEGLENEQAAQQLEARVRKIRALEKEMADLRKQRMRNKELAFRLVDPLPDLSATWVSITESDRARPRLRTP